MNIAGEGIFFILFIIFTSACAHICDRPCSASPEPMKCNFKFVVHAFSINCDNCLKNSTDCGSNKCDNGRRITLAINRQSPGPTIQVCKGDRVVVDVENQLPGSFETSIHWHGQLQRGTPFSDGVSKVTQCPVTPGFSFRYSFVAEQPGTHLYYAHSVSQHADGIYGAMVVNDHSDGEVESKILLLGTRNSVLFSGAYGALHGALMGSHRPVAKLVVNGQEKPDAVKFKTGVTVFKLINAAAHDCPMTLKLENHIFKITKVEGSELLPVYAKKLTIYPGERYDFEVQKMGEQCDSCKLILRGEHDCDKLEPLELKFEPIDLAENYEYKPTADFESLSANCSELDGANICSSDLQGVDDPDFDLAPHQTFHLQFGLHKVAPVTPDDIEFRFVFNDIEYYPTFLDSSDEDGRVVPHINQVSYRPPSTPVLTQPGDREPAFECESWPSSVPAAAIRPKHTCKNAPAYCECSHFIRVDVNATVKLVLQHKALEGFAPTAHTFHLHGHKMYTTGWSSGEGAAENAVERPVARDTVTVPPEGTASAIFRASNPGFWLFESRSGHISSAGVGMALIVQVGDVSQMTKVPTRFPTCRGLKPDDFIF